MPFFKLAAAKTSGSAPRALSGARSATRKADTAQANVRRAKATGMYCTRFFGHKTALGSLVGCECCGHPVAPGLGRASVAVLFQQPVLIVAIEVGPDGGADLFDVLVEASKDDLLLQRTDESLGDADGLGLANEGEVGRP